MHGIPGPRRTRRCTARRDDDDHGDVRQCRSDPTKEATLSIGNVRFTRVLDADDDVEREPLLLARASNSAASPRGTLPGNRECLRPWYCWSRGDDSFDEVVEAVSQFVGDKGVSWRASPWRLIATAARGGATPTNRQLRGVVLVTRPPLMRGRPGPSAAA